MLKDFRTCANERVFWENWKFPWLIKMQVISYVKNVKILQMKIIDENYIGTVSAQFLFFRLQVH